MGRKRHTYWDIIALQALLNLTKQDIKINVTALAEQKKLDTAKKQLFRKAIKKVFDENILDISVNVTFRDKQIEDEYFQRLQDQRERD